ncbi:alpha/beta fold hydrolase [Myceligenerans indicum]|uniref:Alpha/beta hydrolase n=1 Tax=Myceligenerans indicum TaxID=2593663 RepID=A0ABS1LG43_9MICO|nr:alpha/beta hydrolase [Myceligenerans indicum]MBL0885194.1 alpha/beta hydrolase [Myceligenerans indicum]
MTAQPATRSLTAPHGRTITWCEFGDPQGIPVLAAHGSPGSRLQLMPLHDAARDAGVRVVVPDRPGFGGTSTAPDHGFHSWDDDAITLLDALGITRVTLLGFSGGGGYALALASRRPARVARVVLVCGMVPGAPAAALSGRIGVVTLLYRVSRWAPALAAAMLEGRGPFARVREANLSAWPEADRIIMTDPDARKLTAADAEAGLAQGARAGIEDLGRYHRPLPSGLGAVRQPVTLVHGTADGNVPIGVARWAASRLPSATLVEIAGAGHYFAVTSPRTVVTALLPET